MQRMEWRDASRAPVAGGAGERVAREGIRGILGRAGGGVGRTGKLG